jgi:hypothetical protein
VDIGAEARAELARRTIADCDSRLTKYRKAIADGLDEQIGQLGLSPEALVLRATVPGDRLTRAYMR